MKLRMVFAAMVGLAGMPAYGQNGPVDSSADSAAFTQTVESAAGLIIRVPVNGAGEENLEQT